MKKAIVAIFFGVGDIEIKKRCIDTVVDDLQAEFSGECTLVEAWTGEFLRRKMAKAGYAYPNLQEALEKLAAEAYDVVYLMPTHLTPGEEYQKKILPVADAYREKFAQLAVMEPILTVSQPEDFSFLTKGILGLEELAADEALVFMGHGSPHQHNVAYELLQKYADAQGWPLYVGVVEPDDFPNKQDVISRLQAEGRKKVYLRPLLLSGGNHATVDLAGEEPESWKNVLRAAGMEVRYSTAGLGEYPKFRRLYINSLHQLMK